MVHPGEAREPLGHLLLGPAAFEPKLVQPEAGSGGGHGARRSRNRAGRPEGGATRTKVRVGSAGRAYSGEGMEAADSAQDGSKAAITSEPLPDSTGSGKPARPVRMSMKVTPAAVRAARFGCHAG